MEEDCDAGDGALWKTGTQNRSYELDLMYFS